MDETGSETPGLFSVCTETGTSEGLIISHEFRVVSEYIGNHSRYTEVNDSR